MSNKWNEENSCACVKYDIYCGHEDYAKLLWIPETVAQFVKGFTITEGTGYWEGKHEHSVIVTINEAGHVDEVIEKLCCALNKKFGFQCVLVVKSTPCWEFVSGREVE